MRTCSIKLWDTVYSKWEELDVIDVILLDYTKMSVKNGKLRGI